MWPWEGRTQHYSCRTEPEMNDPNLIMRKCQSNHTESSSIKELDYVLQKLRGHERQRKAEEWFWIGRDYSHGNYMQHTSMYRRKQNAL